MKKVIILTSFIAFFSAAAFSQVIKGTYAIKNVETGMLLRIKDANKKDGTPLVAYEPVNWKCMTWDFKHVDGQTYQLKNLFTGKTFQAKDFTDGSSLEQQPFSIATTSQEYEFV
nr:RICIN domain-containing protein [Bacteroidota bacterium]